jgi:serine/threonine protein kinase
MSVSCINPHCRTNVGDASNCPNCGLPTLIAGRYRPVQLVRDFPDPFNGHKAQIWLVEDMEGTWFCPPGGQQLAKLHQSPPEYVLEQLRQESKLLGEVNLSGVPKSEIANLFVLGGEDAIPELHVLVMELLPGESLQDWIESHPLPKNRQILNWALQLSQILKEVHDHHWFHGDIKPANCLVSPEGSISLVDWGSAQNVDSKYLSTIGGNPRLLPRQQLTLGYAAPEQLKNRPTPQSDFYGLGMTLIFAATGLSPIDLSQKFGENWANRWHRKAHLNHELISLINALIVPEPAGRPMTADLVHQHFLKLQRPARRIQQKLLQWRWPLAAGLVGLGLAGLVALGYGASQQREQRVAAVVEQAQKAERVGNFRKARQIYEQALQRIPNNSSLLNNLALVCQDLKDLKCTKDKLEQAIQVEPRGWEALYNLAVLLEDEQNFPGARQLYQRSIQNGPREALPAINLSRLDILAGYPRRALDRLQAIPTQSLWDSNSQWGHAKNVGWAYYVLKDYPQADQWLRKAITIDPERADSYCLLAQLQDLRTNESQSSQIYWLNCLSRPIAVTPEVRRWRIARLKHEYPDVDFSF